MVDKHDSFMFFTLIKVEHSCNYWKSYAKSSSLLLSLFHPENDSWPIGNVGKKGIVLYIWNASHMSESVFVMSSLSRSCVTYYYRTIIVPKY